MIIGLGGKSCSGKNQLASFLADRGFCTLDMDQMAHRVLETLTPELVERFGPQVLSEGKVNRPVLGELVFGDSRKLQDLENILYPALHRVLDTELVPYNGKVPVVLNAAALEKGGFWRRCDSILWVEAPFLLRLYRAKKRDKQPWRKILNRFRAQKRLKPQFFYSKVDTYIIRNSTTRKGLRRKVDTWVGQLSLE